MNFKISFVYPLNFKYLEKSENVKTLQEFLTELGYDIGKAGIDGIYGNDTKKALDEFNKTGKIKKGGKIGDKSLIALTELDTNTTGYKSLSWESTDATRVSWSKFVFETIEKLFDTSFSQCEDIVIFREDYNSLNRNQKVNVWGELISAISYYESSWNTVSRMVETTMNIDPITGNQVASEGLLQLSYQDKRSYNGLVDVECKFDWNLDKSLFLNNPKDPKITILNPYYNLEFGIGILAYQIKTHRKIILTTNFYWAVIKQNGKYEKINKIISFVQKLGL